MEMSADRGAEAFTACSLIVSLCGECQLNARNVNVKTSLCHRVCVCVCVCVCARLHAEVILHVLFFFKIPFTDFPLGLNKDEVN